MKIARLDQLAKQDSLFYDKEPYSRYRTRQIIMVADNYDFAANNATDITSVVNFLENYDRFLITRNKAIEYSTSIVGDWATGNQTDKDLILYFASETIMPVLSTSQKVDIQTLIEPGFTIFENGGVNLVKTWDGASWV
jgi:hypothetical protein